LGDFRLAMEKAVELSQVKVDIVPKSGTMEQLHNPALKFSFGSLYHQEYQRDLDEAICQATGLDTSNDAVTTSNDAVTTSNDTVTDIRRTNVHVTDDSDWYII